jgi:hypothetical protein
LSSCITLESLSPLSACITSITLSSLSASNALSSYFTLNAFIT